MNYFEIIMGLIKSGQSIFETVQKMREHAQQIDPFTPEQDAQFDAEIAEISDYVKHPEFKPDDK